MNKVELASIKGNAEAYLLTPDRDLLIQQGDIWDVDLLNTLQWYQDHLSESDLEWIRALPDSLRWNSAYLVHDSPLDRLAIQLQTSVPAQYRELKYHGRGIRPDMPDADWQKLVETMRLEKMTQVFCGHTHRPFTKKTDELLVCNAGSAGMPLDGDPRPSWVMLTTDDSGNVSAFIRRVTFKISSTHQLIDSTPDYYAFHKAGFQGACKKMFLHGNHWRAYMPK